MDEEKNIVDGITNEDKFKNNKKKIIVLLCIIVFLIVAGVVALIIVLKNRKNDDFTNKKSDNHIINTDDSNNDNNIENQIDEEYSVINKAKDHKIIYDPQSPNAVIINLKSNEKTNVSLKIPSRHDGYSEWTYAFDFVGSETNTYILAYDKLEAGCDGSTDSCGDYFIALFDMSGKQITPPNFAESNYITLDEQFVLHPGGFTFIDKNYIYTYDKNNNLIDKSERYDDVRILTTSKTVCSDTNQYLVCNAKDVEGYVVIKDNKVQFIDGASNQDGRREIIDVGEITKFQTLSWANYEHEDNTIYLRIGFNDSSLNLSSFTDSEIEESTEKKRSDFSDDKCDGACSFYKIYEYNFGSKELKITNIINFSSF